MINPFYGLVMDPERNPLRALPKEVRFQYMLILSYLWSTAFTLWIGSFAVFGPTVAGHAVILIAIFFTGDIFRRARIRALSHRDQMRDPRDGTVLYDDLWGAP
ncbi:MAG: hypothetical protein QNJ94_08010 [Alphaproteobacteria bacterium]|nr:hypothetical protein [Alphaproteobacteria bacterium]